MKCISREVCNILCYGFFNPNDTPNFVDYEDAAYRMATCLKRTKDKTKLRENLNKTLPNDLYLLTLEKYIDEDYIVLKEGTNGR